MADVYRAHVGGVLRALRHAAFQGCTALRSAVELENATCEVFARAFEPRARQAYDGLRPYQNFLAGIARNYVLELFRAGAQDAKAQPLDEAVSDTLPSPEDAHEALEDREVDALLTEFRATLGSEEAQLFELRFVRHLPQESAADELKLTRIQLRRRELALRKRLLSYLKAHGYLEDWSHTGWSFFRKRAGT